MGIVIPFRHRAPAKARRSGTRAAIAANFSADSPALFPTAEFKIACHHSDGITPRCAHLRAAETVAPMSSAIAPGVGHNRMTSLNEVTAGGVGRVMESVLGQIVLNRKAKVSYDAEAAIVHNPGMPDRMSETEEKAAFIRRVKTARMARFDTQKPMLTILGVDQGTYKQYETRTPLPHRFIPKFCAATGVEVEWLLTGEGKGPSVTQYPKVDAKRVSRRPKVRVA